MTTAEGWTAAVRGRLAPGRLLPLGEAADGVWIAERAVREALEGAASSVRGVVPCGFRTGLLGAEEDGPFPVPPGGLPPGRLRIAGEIAVVAGRPLPELTEELRKALFAAAGGLGLRVAEVDLRVTDLLDEAPAPEPAAPPPAPAAPAAPAGDDPVALAALRVTGVAGVTDTVGPAVHRDQDGRVRVEVATRAGHRLPEVAQAVRAAVHASVPQATQVTVLISDVRP
ncbi:MULTISPECIES: hypothetical protein [unclassified Streptomyces]|uniref:hypothetical protein n=1 Tax=unclassified Streptomyces TaxID=2593676 RepID=UPI00368DE036